MALMTLERFLNPELEEVHVFHDIFEDMNRQMDRAQTEMMRDMRHMMHAMNRISLPPAAPKSQGVGDLGNQLELLQDMIVTEKDGSRVMKVQMDVGSFEKPEVKVTGDQVTVHAKHDEETENSKVHHEFRRTFTIPKEVDPKSVKATMSKDGVLTIKSAPLPAIEDKTKS